MKICLFEVMRKWIKRCLGVTFLVLLLLAIFYWDLLLYGLRQGYGQMQIVWNSRSISEILEDSTTIDTLKNKLRYIQEVKDFAEKELGLKKTDNYTTFYDQKGKPLLWVVTACKPFELTPYEWTFGFLGKFSYKGHFNRKYAEADSAELAQLGYDTDISQVRGWSTLGYFKDPVLSSMLRLSNGELAELIIHELTHSTIYLKDSVNFNENLASFVGKKGALLFLEKKFGKSSPELQLYQNELYDDSLYTAFMLQTTQTLKNFYAQKDFQNLDLISKKDQKSSFIREKIAELEKIKFKQRTYTKENLAKMHPNNTFFMWYVRYNSQEAELERLWKNRYESSLQKFILGFSN